MRRDRRRCDYRRTAGGVPSVPVARLRAPEGFTVNASSTDVPLARLLRFTSAGDLVVTRTRAGEVTLQLRDADGDGRADGQRVLLADLDRPHGVALHDGWLYIAETTAIGRAHFDERRGILTGPYEHIVTGLGGDGLHQRFRRRFFMSLLDGQ